MDYLHWLREHASHLLFRNAKEAEIRRINTTARRRALMSEEEMGDNARQLACTLLNVHSEAQQRNSDMYKQMQPHVSSVWRGRNVGFLDAMLEHADYSGREQLRPALIEGWDVTADVRPTGYFDLLSPEQYAAANAEKRESDEGFVAGRPSATAAHARAKPGAIETWQTWQKKFLNHYSSGFIEELQAKEVLTRNALYNHGKLRFPCCTRAPTVGRQKSSA